MNTFTVELLTPDKVLFCGEVVCLTVFLNDGKMQVMANHMVSLCSIVAGKCSLVFQDGTKKHFTSNDGILCIRRGKTTITSDFLEWEEDVQKALELREEHVKNELLRRKDSYLQYKKGLVAIEGIFANLKKTAK